jgi:hypothetical protein
MTSMCLNSQHDNLELSRCTGEVRECHLVTSLIDHLFGAASCVHLLPNLVCHPLTLFQRLNEGDILCQVTLRAAQLAQKLVLQLQNPLCSCELPSHMKGALEHSLFLSLALPLSLSLSLSHTHTHTHTHTHARTGTHTYRVVTRKTQRHRKWLRQGLMCVPLDKQGDCQRDTGNPKL